MLTFGCYIVRANRQSMQTVRAFDERRLLQQVAEGDEKAFAMLVEQKWNNIYAQALTYVKSTHHAQDIVQEVFLKVWEKRQTLIELERFDSYLFIIARNYIISELRKKITVPIGDKLIESFEEESKAPDRILVHKQLTELVERAMQLLPPQQKITIKLSREEGLSHEEIAKHMELSKETVKKHICRALNFLRTYVRTHSELTIIFIMIFNRLSVTFCQ